MAAESFVGRSPDHLSLPERAALAGRWAAFERYTPQTLPLRLIEAIGTSAGDCARQLRARGLDPLKFEFVLMR